MTTLDRDLLKAVRASMDAALLEVARKHGLTSLKAGNASFDPSAGSFHFKVEGVVEGAKGKDASRYEMAARFDKALPPLGVAFKSGSRVYTLTGMNSTGSKFTVLRDDDKPFLFKRDQALALMKIQGVAP
jgi:hypothetical protein